MARLSLEPTYDAKGDMVVCPSCGGNCVHPEEHESSSIEGTSPLGLRGPWHAIRFWCELCPQAWYLVLGFHKGQTYVENRTILGGSEFKDRHGSEEHRGP